MHFCSGIPAAFCDLTSAISLMGLVQQMSAGPQVLSTTAYQYTASTQSCFSPVSHNIGIVGGIGKRSPACQCMGRREAEVWQCRSKLARGLIVRRCLTHFAGGFKAWAYVLMISLACMLGLWSASPTMHRYLLGFYHAHSTAWLSL